jgi:hypothetical protein
MTRLYLDMSSTIMNRINCLDRENKNRFAWNMFSGPVQTKFYNTVGLKIMSRISNEILLKLGLKIKIRLNNEILLKLENKLN